MPSDSHNIAATSSAHARIDSRSTASSATTRSLPLARLASALSSLASVELRAVAMSVTALGDLSSCLANSSPAPQEVLFQE